MKTILLPYHGDPPDDVALDTACLVARRFGSHIDGLYVRQPPPIIAAEGITLPGDYLTQFAEESRQIAVRSQERFHSAMRERGIPFRDLDAPGDEPAAGWRDVEGLERQVVGELGRLFDLIVVASTAEPSVPDRNATAEAALFDSGRPVLVAPPQTPRTLGDVVAIMWNGSTETARTVALGMPLLRQARSVTVVTVEGATVPGPAGQDVAAHLVRNGINATFANLATDGTTGGEAMLAECERLGADLLFKGAYTQSRLRQMIFGGATRYILANARIPVLLAH